MPELAPGKPALIVVNPKAGRRLIREVVLPQVLAVFADHGVETRLVRTRYPGHATKLVRDRLRDVGLVVVVGGDGSVDEVVAAIDGTDTPVGIIPLGTANVLSLDLGIPQNPLEAARVIVDGNTRRVDIGYINGRPFVLMASAGFDAFTVHATEPRIKVIAGKLAYLFSALWAALTYRWKRLVVEVPDRGIRDTGYLAIASNSRFYGGRLNFDPAIRIDDGRLDLLLFKKASILDVFRTLMALLTRSRLRPTEIAVYRGGHFILYSKSRMYIQVDGDKVPDHEADIQIGRGRLNVFAPTSTRG